MDPAAFKEKLNQFVADDQLDEAATSLVGFWKGRNAGLEALSLAQLRRLKGLQTQQQKGTVSDSDAFVERAKITDALLQIIEQTDAPKPAIPEALRTLLPPEKPGFWRIAVPLAAAFLLITGFLAFRSFFNQPADFTLSVNFQESGDGGKVIRGGKARVILGGRPLDEKEINTEGRIFYEQISAASLNDSIQTVVLDMPYRVAGQSAYVVDKNRSITVFLDPVQDTLIWRGNVLDGLQRPVENAVIDVENGLANGQTDAMGHYSIKIPADAGDQVQVVVFLGGKVVRNARFTLSETTPQTIILDE